MDMLHKMNGYMASKVIREFERSNQNEDLNQSEGSIRSKKKSYIDGLTAYA